MLNETWSSGAQDVKETIQLLNQSFGGGWDEDHYRWYLARPFDGRDPDRLTISNDDMPVAGSVINYRQIKTSDGAIHDIGIASGSWTRPDYRGRGLFSNMMRMSVAHAGSKGCRYFLAFVTEDNASCGALARLDAIMVPAAYLMTAVTGTRPQTVPDLRISAVTVDADMLYARISGGDYTLFHYRSATVWAEQLLARPNPVEVLAIGDNDYAIIEQTADTDRLQWTSVPLPERRTLGESLAARAADNRRKFFMYGTERLVAASGGDGLLSAKPGFVACLPTRSGDTVDIDAWDLQSGDRM